MKRSAGPQRALKISTSKNRLKKRFLAPKVLTLWHLIYLSTMQANLHETGHKSTSSNGIDENLIENTVTRVEVSAQNECWKWPPLNPIIKVFLSVCLASFFVDPRKTWRALAYPRGLQAHLMWRHWLALHAFRGRLDRTPRPPRALKIKNQSWWDSPWVSTFMLYAEPTGSLYRSVLTIYRGKLFLELQKSLHFGLLYLQGFSPEWALKMSTSKNTPKMLGFFPVYLVCFFADQC